MAESLLLPVVRGVVGKAADALVKRVTRMWGVDDDRDRLERRLAYVQSLLADAEVQSETNDAVRTWMKALKAAAYRADDVLDDFQYEALRREAQSRGSTTSKVLSCFNIQNKLVFRHKASKELKNVLDTIEELVDEMDKFRLVERLEVAQVSHHRQTQSALDESAEIYGRGDDKEAVVNLLLDQQDQRSVQVLPIIGMGGLGKTTLAQVVYNDPRVQKHFELKVWYCVSENFKDTVVLRSVIALATEDRCDLPDNIELLRQRLHQVIGGKRFLLIFDDVWNEEPHKWEDNLKPILCSSVSGSGSMIVVTSRSQQVASIMGTLPPYELAFLSKDDSWDLFSKKAFHNRMQEKEGFSKIGRRIVEKCQGLPLALKTMGALMNSKKQVQEWEAIAESDISATSGGKDEVLPILKLSYRHLSAELKQCFAFCAVFPKDYEMEKDKLIKLWMANGFIHEEGQLNLAQKGELVFDELVWRAFLQDVKVRSFDNFVSYLGVRCKMHDLMHDLANYVTDECQFAEELSQKKASVLHLQLLGTQINGSIKGTSFLRTLLTQAGPNKDLSELKLRSLRALCCINPSIRTQFTTHLRYLDLSGSWNIDRLPNSICTLYNLQTLRLNGCTGLQQLPEGMTSMKKLSHVYLFACRSLQHMPPKLSLMHNLQTLTTFVVGTGDGFGIEELKDLGQLGNRLELYNLKKVKSGSKANLHSKHNLNELLLHWGHPYVPSFIEQDVDTTNEKEVDTTNEKEVDTTNEEEVLESLVPHGELKGLEVCEYSGLAIPQWMKKPNMFKALTKLIMSMCPRCTDLPIVWLSSSLEYLSLHRMDSLTTLCKRVNVAAAGYNNSPQIFPKLKRMELKFLSKLETWEENSEKEPNSLPVLPQLEKLTIRKCNKLSTLPESPLLTYLLCDSLSGASQVPKSMPLSSWSSISYLRIGFPANVVPPQKDKGCKSHSVPDTLRKLYLEGDDGFQSTFNSSNLQLGLRDCLAFVEDLTISSCSNIVSWPMEELWYFPRLRSLRFFRCNNLGEKGSFSEEILPLPRLEALTVECCDSVLGIPKLSAPLGKLKIRNCKNWASLTSESGNLVKLRDLYVWGCSALKALPDGLTSLERLTIEGCPGIEEFPPDLQQRLPDLKHLEIDGCPGLLRRCGEGGEYFNLISSIPDKDIRVAEDRELPVKRLLPLCGGDSQLSCLRF